MNKGEIKKFITKIISSSPELKEGFLALLKNKTGYMKNIILEGCNRKTAGTLAYFIANSDENVKKVFTNQINFKVKKMLEKSSGIRINDEAFRAVMREVVDDLADRGSA